MTIHLAGGAVTLHHGDCREVLAGLEDASISSIVTDPPYELGFMGKAWDASGIAYNVEMWRECLRVLKPGGHLLAFGGTRTYHRMTVAIEDAGFEIRDSIHWLYGSGFPKSLDVSKAIDKVNGEPDRLLKFTAWMRTTGLTARQIDEITDTNMGGHYLTAKSQPAIPTAAMWQVLRPHCGDVPEWVDQLVARIEAEREVVGTDTKARSTSGLSALPTVGGDTVYQSWDITAPATDAAKRWEGWGTALKPAHEPVVMARKPLIGTVAANVLEHGTGALNIDGTRVQMSDADRQTIESATWVGRNLERKAYGTYGSDGTDRRMDTHTGGRWPANVVVDQVISQRHGWARYFYCAKPNGTERNAGLEANHHPTVKPVELMRWLIRLVTPPDGTVLDPFAGSGTTLVAAVFEGFAAVGIEITEEYLPIITGRVTEAHITPQQLDLFGGVA